jgi:transposase
MTRKYSDEFKREAVRQVLERGYAINDVAERLGVSTKSLYKWVAEERLRRGGDDDDALVAMRRENARLKSELKRAEEERDILKKAAAYFAKASG